MHILFLLQTAFSIWMLFDAINRGARYFWYWIILMPFGEWVYFFSVKIHDPQFVRWKRRLTEKKLSLKELEYRAKRSPSQQNRLLYAQALHDHGNFSKSAALFRDILDSDSEEKRALYGLARCLLETEQTKEAIETLEDLVARDFDYENFLPGEDLARNYWESGNREQAIELMEKIVRKSQRLRHTLLLSEYLHEQRESERAKELLEEALLDYENSPKYIRRSERVWAKKAKSHLRSLT